MTPIVYNALLKQIRRILDNMENTVNTKTQVVEGSRLAGSDKVAEQWIIWRILRILKTKLWRDLGWQRVAPIVYNAPVETNTQNTGQSG